MNKGGSLINFGELSKPATVLIEKISEATGGIFRPYQIRRVAQAEAEAEKIKAVAQIEIEELQRRALHRFLNEEAKKQNNIESITQKALPAVEEKARPQEIENDWITNFYDKCRLISDEEMQNLWSKVLAGQANKPGKFSKRTVNLLASLDKTDAELFRSLCSFVWFLEDEPLAMVYRLDDHVCAKAGIHHYMLEHLQSLGLIYFERGLNTYGKHNQPAQIVVVQGETRASVKFQKPGKNEFVTGKVFLSKAGQELAQVCNPVFLDDFKNNVLDWWKRYHYTVSEI
jgi:hypothetical protein